MCVCAVCGFNEKLMGSGLSFVRAALTDYMKLHLRTENS